MVWTWNRHRVIGSTRQDALHRPVNEFWDVSYGAFRKIDFFRKFFSSPFWRHQSYGSCSSVPKVEEKLRWKQEFELDAEVAKVGSGDAPTLYSTHKTSEDQETIDGP
jgi:hypothetical protein